jgi:hypothetical protein
MAIYTAKYLIDLDMNKGFLRVEVMEKSQQISCVFSYVFYKNIFYDSCLNK